MAKPATFIAASAGIALLLSALWLEGACPGRAAQVIAAAGGPALFKPYHIGDNPWAGAWLAESAATARANSGDRDSQQRLARHSAWTDACERETETPKAGVSS
jgi:hypothetical protein